MKKEIPKLSWKKGDYETRGLEAPDIFKNDNTHTEEELMSDLEVIDWIIDTEKTFLVIRQQSEDKFNELYEAYISDIQYLTRKGRIPKEEADELIKKDRFEF